MQAIYMTCYHINIAVEQRMCRRGTHVLHKICYGTFACSNEQEHITIVLLLDHGNDLFVANSTLHSLSPTIGTNSAQNLMRL